MAKVPASIREIQAMEVAPEEIIYLIQEMAQRHGERGPGEVDSYTAVAILPERYRGKEHGRSFCVMERMRCMTASL
jgi:hypothetical protein